MSVIIQLFIVAACPLPHSVMSRQTGSCSVVPIGQRSFSNLLFCSRRERYGLGRRYCFWKNYFVMSMNCLSILRTIFLGKHAQFSFYIRTVIIKLSVKLVLTENMLIIVICFFLLIWRIIFERNIKIRLHPINQFSSFL